MSGLAASLGKMKGVHDTMPMEGWAIVSASVLSLCWLRMAVS